MSQKHPVNSAVREHSQALWLWMRSPLVRFLVPDAILASIAVLRDHAFRTSDGPDHMIERPRVGAVVRLLRFDGYLHREHNAVPGTEGIVVGHSGLSPYDDGVLVSWGGGRPVRTNLDELALISEPAPRKTAVPRREIPGHLSAQPAVGAEVRLLVDDIALRHSHGAQPGSVGTVVAHSHVFRDDRGVLVDFGTGGPVRTTLEELAAV